MVIQLRTTQLTKPWGRHNIPSIYGLAEAVEPLGEIWFERPQEGLRDALLVKYLFTSERLSIQVHPNDSTSRAAGRLHGKDEAWIVLEAAPGAEIGLGFQKNYSKKTIAKAALEGSLPNLLKWRAVAPGDVFYSPAGTIHSIGAGLTLVEIQQNVDLTYRLFDFGRDRELHIEEALEAVNVESRPEPSRPKPVSKGRIILARGTNFVVEKIEADTIGVLHASKAHPLWLVPLGAGVKLGTTQLPVPSVWIAEDSVPLGLHEGPLLVAYSGSKVRRILD
jgi:mannose-6-phosphate isomerase